MPREKTTTDIIDEAVKERFRKHQGILGRLFPGPTVLACNRSMIVDPLVEAVERHTDEEKKRVLQDVLYAIIFLHPDYRFTTSAPTILIIAGMLARGRRGDFHLETGVRWMLFNI